MPPSTDILQGTLDVLILKTLAHGPMHGWGIATRIQQISADVLQIGQGSLYPALHRLEQQGWIKGQRGQTATGREAKFYALTKEGERQLGRELDQWRRLSSAVGLVVERA